MFVDNYPVASNNGLMHTSQQLHKHFYSLCLSALQDLAEAERFCCQLIVEGLNYLAEYSDICPYKKANLVFR